MHIALSRAVEEAARQAARDSFMEHGHALAVNDAWRAVTQKLLKSDPFLWDMLPEAMPEQFRAEYAKHCVRLSVEKVDAMRVSA